MRGSFVALLALAVLSSAAADGPRLPRYGPAVLVATLALSDLGEGVHSVDAADMTGDGLVDVVVTHGHYGTTSVYAIRVLRNDGRGGFVDATASLFEGAPPLLQFPREVVIADFNNDGRPDVFVADTGDDRPPGPGFHNTLVLSTRGGKLRDATGNLPARVRFTHSAAAGDVNGDGSLDIYVGSIYTESHDEPPELLLNDGAGAFHECADCLPSLLSAPVIVEGSALHGPTYTASELVDVDNDNDRDLVLAGNGFYRVPSGIVSSDSQILRNDGNGHFSVLVGALPPRPWANTAEGVEIKGADINRDGFRDLVFAYTQQEPYYVGRWLQILINNRDGTFRDETQSRLPQSESNTETWLKFLDIADLNGDGRVDILGHPAEFFRSEPPMYLQRNDGSFEALPAGYSRTGGDLFATIDLRGDGHRDFLTIENGYTTFPRAAVRVVRELGGPEPPATPMGARAMRDPATGRVVAAWPYVWGAARYEVWRSAKAKQSGRLIATTRLTRFVDKTAPAGAAYYRIRAVNAAGRSGLTAPVARP